MYKEYQLFWQPVILDLVYQAGSFYPDNSIITPPQSIPLRGFGRGLSVDGYIELMHVTHQIEGIELVDGRKARRLRKEIWEDVLTKYGIEMPLTVKEKILMTIQNYRI